MAEAPYAIEVTRDALAHIRMLPKKYHRLVFDVLRAQLSHEPATETRNRKPLTLPAPFEAHWELRFGPRQCLRAFYTIDGSTVVAAAVGIKDRSRLRIGGEEVTGHEASVDRRGESEAE